MGRGRVCPALWARPRSRWSSWPVIPIPHPPQPRILEAESSPVVLGALAAHGPLAIPVAPNNTPTRWMEHQRRQAACLRTTRCRTSYEFPNPAAGAVCGTMTGCVRHCGRDHTHGNPVGQSQTSGKSPCPGLWPGTTGDDICSNRECIDIHGASWRLPTPHAHAGRCIWRGQRPATVLCADVHHADLLRWRQA